MKEMDEHQLRGWRPRRASAGLRRKTFRAPDTAMLAWDFSRLAPAVACLFFTLMILHFNAGTWRENRMATGVNFYTGSNAVAFSNYAQERENHLDNVTFDWTNKGAIQSSIGSHFGSMPTTNF